MNEIESKRLHWRCRRGLLELDVLLGGFLEQRYGVLAEREQRAFARLLTHADNDVWAWITRQAAAPDQEIGDLVDKIRS